MMKFLLIIVFWVSSFVFSKPQPAPWFIDELRGCFHVTYHYQETGRPTFTETSQDWIELRPGDGTSYLLVHHGIFPGSVRPRLHWGQRWTVRPNNTFEQRVYGPDLDEVRYQCTSVGTTFEMGPTRQRNFLRRCEAGSVPSPRRDRNRDDYTRLDRIHILRINAAGFSDVQRNTRFRGNGTVLSTEEGWNEYTKIPNRECGQ